MGSTPSLLVSSQPDLSLRDICFFLGFEQLYRNYIFKYLVSFPEMLAKFQYIIVAVLAFLNNLIICSADFGAIS